MKEIIVLTEHRRGEIRDVTWEMLSKGRQLAESIGAEIGVALLGNGVGALAEALKPKAHRVFLVEDQRLEAYNSETYEKVLTQLITERKPVLTLVGHTAMGMDFAPGLAAHLKMPLATDCIGIDATGETFSLTRQLYGGKVNATASFLKKAPYIVTLRSGAFPASEKGALPGEIIKLPSPLTDEGLAKRFLQYVEAAVGEVDITQADILVSVGRGIKEAQNIPMVKEFADAVGGTLSCSRPVVDKKWLPKDRQVGTSGKTVKPKVYIAIGISGAFQHIAGMKGAGTIIAINKDPKAPIFGVATYGIVADLFKLVPVLKDKIKELRQK
ncbi:MAG TPA: electron transfer flavoprotein subunit alpha/FixB family protein [Thermodesulfobacteriota bacterium]|nr:electron transfer flavoprotein subunit alpha/FixB family protein [Thermodesulfobacteriota bacterium]